MERIKIYIFESVSEAESFIQTLNEITGYPSEDGSTLTYCNYETYNGIVFIRHDSFVDSVITRKPTEIEITTENPFTNETI